MHGLEAMAAWLPIRPKRGTKILTTQRTLHCIRSTGPSAPREPLGGNGDICMSVHTSVLAYKVQRLEIVEHVMEDDPLAKSRINIDDSRAPQFC